MNKENFYQNLCNENFSENLMVLKNDNSGFYELCQKYVDIALNAPKKRTEDGAIAGVFQFTDIDIAKEATITFAKTHRIDNIGNLLDSIKKVYTNSIDDNDKRQHSAFDQNPSYSYQSIGVMGKYYNFTYMPDETFEIIKSEIIKEFEAELAKM